MLAKGRAHEGALGPAFYDKAFSNETIYPLDWRQSPYIALWIRVVAILATRAPTSILELGCGPGHLAVLLHQAFPRASYHGVDFSPAAIARAKKTSPDLSFDVQDLRTPAPYDHVCDAVVATEVLEHVDDDLAILQRLAKRAYGLFTVPTHDSAAHVRYFTSSDAVAERYGPFLDALAIEPFPSNEEKVRWWIFSGYVRP